MQIHRLLFASVLSASACGSSSVTSSAPDADPARPAQIFVEATLVEVPANLGREALAGAGFERAAGPDVKILWSPRITATDRAHARVALCIGGVPKDCPATLDVITSITEEDHVLLDLTVAYHGEDGTVEASERPLLHTSLEALPNLPAVVDTPFPASDGRKTVLLVRATVIRSQADVGAILGNPF